MLPWAVGVTTVPSRAGDLLSRTVASLEEAGFRDLRLFVDGGDGACDMSRICASVTTRFPFVGPFGNWYLALLELYIRQPAVERYAIFQDDLVCVKGLKRYLDGHKYPDGSDGRKPGYWNLFTFMNSEGLTKPGWQEGPIHSMGIDPEQVWQCGRGALGLVFNRQAVQLLLSSSSMANKPASATNPRVNIDGAVVAAMNLAGWREYVHNPSLLSHTGMHTSIQEPGKVGKVWTTNAKSFPGEMVDITRLMAASQAQK